MCVYKCPVRSQIDKEVKEAPLMVTYHYVKFYVSIIIQLEVININVRNFKFPIGFYSNPTPFEPPKIWLWSPLPQNFRINYKPLSDIIKIWYVGR
jgi:hypothetical protein